MAMPSLQRVGLLGVVERDDGVDLYLPARTDVGIDGEWRPEAVTDWSVRWREGLEPVTVGRLTVAPPWRAGPASDDQIVIEPGQAFGTGHHETTAAALHVLQELDLVQAHVLDVGTGSGVLAIAAARLGAGRVVAVDTDPVAVGVARDNALANRVPLDVRRGSVEVAPGSFDVVVANLDTDLHHELAGQLIAHLAPGAVLVAGGISRAREEEAAAIYETSGREVLRRSGREWTTLLVRPDDA